MLTLAQDAAMAGRRLAEALREGERLIALTGENGPQRAAAVASVVASPDINAICVANPLPAPLSLPRIMFQINVEGMAIGPDDAVAVIKTLIAHNGGGRRIVLVIQDAETLDQEALQSLQDMAADPAYAALSILFVGKPGFLERIGDGRLARLQDALVNVAVDAGPRTASPEIEIPRAPAAPPEKVAVLPTATGMVVRHVPVPPRTRRRWAVGAAAFLAVGALAGLVWTHGTERQAAPQPAGPDMPPPIQPEAAATMTPAPPLPATPAPAPPASPAQAPAPETQASQPPPLAAAQPVAPPPPLQPPPLQPPPLPPQVAALPGSGAGDSTPAQAVERLRQDFNAFLDHAGQDTEHLTDAQRQALFREYLAWRRQQAAKPEAPTQ
jgi:hypothetical protein